MKVTILAAQAGASAAALLDAVLAPPAPPGAVLRFDDAVAASAAIARGSTVTVAFTTARAERLAGRGGPLAFRVAVAVSFDGGRTFSAETPLLPDASGAVHELALRVPEDAVSIALYAHVRAFVADGGREIEIADAYDNPGGAFTNYVLSVG